MVFHSHPMVKLRGSTGFATHGMIRQKPPQTDDHIDALAIRTWGRSVWIDGETRGKPWENHGNMMDLWCLMLNNGS